MEWSCVSRNQGIRANRVRWPIQDQGLQYGSQYHHQIPSIITNPQYDEEGAPHTETPQRLTCLYYKLPSREQQMGCWIQTTESCRNIKTLHLFKRKIAHFCPKSIFFLHPSSVICFNSRLILSWSKTWTFTFHSSINVLLLHFIHLPFLAFVHYCHGKESLPCQLNKVYEVRFFIASSTCFANGTCRYLLSCKFFI